jgi:hypothetical protein
LVGRLFAAAISLGSPRELNEVTNDLELASICALMADTKNKENLSIAVIFCRF